MSEEGKIPGEFRGHAEVMRLCPREYLDAYAIRIGKGSADDLGREEMDAAHEQYRKENHGSGS